MYLAALNIVSQLAVLAMSFCPVHKQNSERHKATAATAHCSAGDSGDAAIRAAFEEIVAPAAHRFKPDMILVGWLKQHGLKCMSARGFATLWQQHAIYFMTHTFLS